MKTSRRGELLNQIERAKTLKDNLDKLEAYYERKGLPKGKNYFKKTYQITESLKTTLNNIRNYGKLKIHVVHFNHNQLLKKLHLPIPESEIYAYMEFFYPNSTVTKITSYFTGEEYMDKIR